jgi:hypothetical protein
MTEWKGPIQKDVGRNILFTLPVFIVLFFVLFWVVQDTGALLCLSVIVPVLLIIFAIFHTHYRGNVGGYVHSRWDMDKDHVAGRIDRAIRAKGINVVIGYEGDTVIFPLPPLNIVVANGSSRTKVYVGPLTSDNREKVTALTAFVSTALAVQMRRL